MSIRVTDAMIAERQAIGGYPFVRIVAGRERGMVEVQRATKATPPKYPRLDWLIEEWAPPVLRQASLDEAQELFAMKSDLARRVEAQLDREAGMLDQLAKLQAQQQAAAATAACGYDQNPDTAVSCSESEERLCQAGPARIITVADLLARTRQRPTSCPRRRAWAAQRTISADQIRSRCVRRRIPADISQRLLGPKEAIEERPALLEARKWASSDRSFLVLCASNQAGKSFAAGSWLQSLSRDGLFVSQFDIRNAIIPDPEERAYGLIRQMYDAHALVLDNVEGSLSDAVKEVIEGLVIKFHGAAKKIAITTSLSAENFLNLWRVKGTKTGPVFERLVKYGTLIEVPSWISQ